MLHFWPALAYPDLVSTACGIHIDTDWGGVDATAYPEECECLNCRNTRLYKISLAKDYLLDLIDDINIRKFYHG